MVALKSLQISPGKMSPDLKAVYGACILQHTYLYDCLDENKPFFGIFDIFRIFHARIAPVDIFEIVQKKVIFQDSGDFRDFWSFSLIFHDFLYTCWTIMCINICQKDLKTLKSCPNNHPQWFVGLYGDNKSLFRDFIFTDTLLANFATPNMYIYCKPPSVYSCQDIGGK